MATVSSNRVRNAIAASRITATIPAATPKLANYSPMPHVLPANVVISPLVGRNGPGPCAGWPNMNVICPNFVMVKLKAAQRTFSKSMAFPAKLARLFASKALVVLIRTNVDCYGVRRVKNLITSAMNKIKKEPVMEIADMIGSMILMYNAEKPMYVVVCFIANI